jgi:hypothetical protein
VVKGRVSEFSCLFFIRRRIVFYTAMRDVLQKANDTCLYRAGTLHFIIRSAFLNRGIKM